uniref:Uncharacterized protein n=1 Tax=Anguilla anguilla TaxID=7936 RepID=A0A0E9VY79_ANGAN
MCLYRYQTLVTFKSICKPADKKIGCRQKIRTGH